jgi:hypothetical protein
MTEDSNDSEDFTDISDEEIHDLSQEFTEAVPEALGKATLRQVLEGWVDQNQNQSFGHDYFLNPLNTHCQLQPRS